MQHCRYALYYTPPPDSLLWRTGSRWLGYDSASGDPVDLPMLTGHSGRSLADLTRRPRRYGFHATLKPPFHLRSDTSECELLQAVRDFAGGVEGPSMTLDLGLLDEFMALRPIEGEARAATLAERILRTFDRFRRLAPASNGKPSALRKLTQRERQLLDEWGYPFVLDRFCFHMTLTERLEPAMRFRAERWARQVFGPLLPVQLRADAVTVLRQDGPARPFRQILRQSLGDTD